MTSRLAALALLLAASPAFAAGPFDSDWAPGAKSRARLIADGAGAGFEIALDPGAITYWRDPGEAGVPPTFDFSGSDNLAKAEVEFPAPERIPEPDGSVAFGYRGGVVLPIRVVAADPGKPVRLVAKVNYAVCEKICLPARASAALALGAPGASPNAAALDAARGRVPQRVDAGRARGAGQRDGRQILAALPCRRAARSVRRGAGGLLGRAEARGRRALLRADAATGARGRQAADPAARDGRGRRRARDRGHARRLIAARAASAYMRDGTIERNGP